MIAATIISAVLTAGASIFGGISGRKAQQHARLPGWLSPADFRQKDYRIELILGGLILLIVVIVIVAALIAKKK
jgi:hypothetical protein